MDHPRSQRVSAPGRPPDLRDLHAGAAGTSVSVELCSTPSKVLRFAPTPLARGLRTLTASARSSRPWLLRAGQVSVRAGAMSRETDTLMTSVDDERLTTVSCGGILRSLRDATRHPLHVARREALIERRPRARSTASRNHKKRSARRRTQRASPIRNTRVVHVAATAFGVRLAHNAVDASAAIAAAARAAVDQLIARSIARPRREAMTSRS